MNAEKNLSGLSAREVQERIKEGKLNISKLNRKYSVVRIVFENSVTAFNLINLSILAFLLFYYIRTGDYRLLYDSIGVISITIFNIVAGSYQKISAAKALEKVELMQKSTIIVIRDGNKQEIDIEDIVEDDLIFLSKGDQVPVDGKVISSHYLQIDESLLTGESLPQDKKEGDELLSGSFCVYGQGYVVAEKVGDDNFASQVTHLAKKYKLLTSPLMKKINWIFFISFAVTIIMVLVEFIQSSLTSSISVTEIRKISTIAFSLIPEGLVFFATVTFTVGIYRISKLGAIVQKINAIDSFSTINVVCMDKTGTITKNNIKVAGVFPVNQHSDNLDELLGSYCKLSTEQNATIKALEDFPVNPSYKLIDEIPFRSDIKMSLMLLSDGKTNKLYVMGAYDILSQKLTEESSGNVAKIYYNQKLKGFRNLLFGTINFEQGDKINHESINNSKIEPICIISLKDEAREDAREALELFRKNHIELKIVSGDSSDSVLSTLHEINWSPDEAEVITGAELDLLDANNFDNAVRSKTVFTRLNPEHKLKIVRSLKHQKIQTAVIGDGVNDLPAIKAADLGISMDEGSKITKQISEIILLNNKFSILPSIFREGNKIINTVRFVAKLYLTKTNTIFLLSLLSWFFSFTYPLTPRKSSLISVLGVGIPCYLIALINRNDNAYHSFFKDLFIYVITSSAMILGISFGAYYTAYLLFGFTASHASQLMLISLVTMMILNYLLVVYFDDPDNRKRNILYSTAILSVFLFFAIFELNFIPLSWLKMFYELGTTSFHEWLFLSVTLLPGILIFMTIHKLRFSLMEKYFYKNKFQRHL
jgi:cation-transporting ATPase E